jgi:hypothetical protein
MAVRFFISRASWQIAQGPQKVATPQSLQGSSGKLCIQDVAQHVLTVSMGTMAHSMVHMRMPLH